MHYRAEPRAREQDPEHESSHGGDENGAVPVQCEPGQEDEQYDGE
jgi:hypothetical protein